MRNDFLMIGLGLLVVGFFLLLMAFPNEPIVRVLGSADPWVLGLGVITTIGGGLYLLAAMTRAPVVEAPPRAISPEVETPAVAETSDKTGPGWHCSWCWAPLEKGSKYCNECGHKID